ncbi:hypothetical protein LO762_20835 [Actinocorallia sp. API 0066]|uniref:BtpA/SgcQ family protein n=1 Tax=Actinocorallia sp. API 0066 TaxID=2896846 RepID=UPI001E4B39FE|nr:BtpA/SgcQ family protein [Actinocorallia sp. API 0066]MCD0451621.1 hypothetical protein [Actinocorallia sp. API 0066]
MATSRRPGKVCYGVIHLGPLPGTPFYVPGSFDRVVADALGSALALHEGGAHGCLVQTADRVYSTRDEADPARIAAVSLIVRAIAERTGGGFRVGVQIMRHATRASLAVAKLAGGGFVRAGALVGATMSNHGLVNAEPADVMAYRRTIDAWDVELVADVDSTHFQWFGGGKPTADVARAARLVGADAVCLGGPDEERTLATLAAVRAAVPGLPLFLAGHTTHENARRLLAGADGAFVGGCLTDDGWNGPIRAEKVAAYMEIVRSLDDAG